MAALRVEGAGEGVEIVGRVDAVAAEVGDEGGEGRVLRHGGDGGDWLIEDVR